jgi:hypothetical protein
VPPYLEQALVQIVWPCGVTSAPILPTNGSGSVTEAERRVLS